MKKYPIKLEWKNLITIGTILISIISGSFGFGVYISNELAKTKIAKLERKWEDEKAEIKRELNKVIQENDNLHNQIQYLKWRISVTNKKYEEVEEFFKLLEKSEK